MNSQDELTVFVLEKSVLTLRVDRSDAPRVLKVAVATDGRVRWLFEEPGWQSIRFGMTVDKDFYFWSARSLIVFSRFFDQEPDVLRIDEDIQFVFNVSAGWLLVCETSIRLVKDGDEVRRLELDDVAETAVWDDEILVLHDARDYEHRFVVTDEIIEVM